MDLRTDHEGNLIVHLCGCPEHGPVTLWEMHSLEWRAQHRQEARRALGAGFGEKDRPERPHREVR